MCGRWRNRLQESGRAKLVAAIMEQDHRWEQANKMPFLVPQHG
jgi:hypothetical protein